jgi:endonuclease G
MRAELVDYRNSGYDRGHMAPAGDFKRSREAMSETFLLSNMTPQRPSLNRGMWERLEEQVRSLARSHGSIWVVVGTLFLDSAGQATEPETFIGPNSVAVPTHFYKAILCAHPDSTYEMFGFMMENCLNPLTGQPRDYVISVRNIEDLTGLDFFNYLPDTIEDSLESNVNTRWPPP